MKNKKSSHFYLFSLHPIWVRFPIPKSSQLFLTKFLNILPVFRSTFAFSFCSLHQQSSFFFQNSAQHFFNAFSSREMPHSFQFGTLKTLVFSSKKLSFFLSYKFKTLTLNSIETQTLPRASSARQRAYLQEVWVRVPPRPN